DAHGGPGVTCLRRTARAHPSSIAVHARRVRGGYHPSLEAVMNRIRLLALALMCAVATTASAQATKQDSTKAKVAATKARTDAKMAGTKVSADAKTADTKAKPDARVATNKPGADAK